MADEEKTIYSLLRALVARATFMSEQEQREYGEVINRAEAVNMFGTMATQIVVKKGEQNV